VYAIQDDIAALCGQPSRGSRLRFNAQPSVGPRGLDLQARDVR
jgi:hypothetical protein